MSAMAPQITSFKFVCSTVFTNHVIIQFCTMECKGQFMEINDIIFKI